MRAIRERQLPEPGKCRALVTLYKEGPFQKLAPSTQRIWGHWLDRIASYFGTLSIAQFDRPERIRPIIRNWRNQWSDKPRTADYGMQVLSAVLSHAVDPLGKLTGNPCIGIKQLYASNRSDIIWTEADIARVKQACTAEMAHAIDLAAASGLRLGELLRLSWSHVGTDAIVIRTGKSKGKREAIIPLYDDLRDVLARIPKRSTRVLTNSRGRPWLTSGRFIRTVPKSTEAVQALDMRAGIVVNVTRADRRLLEAIVLDRSAPQKHVWRANIILAGRRLRHGRDYAPIGQIEAGGLEMAGAVHGGGR